MSDNPASNVIPMRELDRSSPDPQAAQFDRLLKECRNLALERLDASVSAMLDKTDDALWGLADQTHDRELRDVILTAKDKAVSQRKNIESQFHDYYLAEFDLRVRRERKTEDFSKFDLSSLELGLVNDEDLEETLRVNEMAAKLRRYCEEELNALDQRVGVLIGDATLQGEANPFSPQAMCKAYRQTCRELDASLKIRMIFLKLFDDHVLDDIRSIYKDINGLLIQRSILPKIRYGVRRSTAGIGPRIAAPSAPADDPTVDQAASIAGRLPGAAFAGVAMPGVGVGDIPFAGGAISDAGYAGEVGAGGEQDLFAVLQGLLAMNAQGARGVGPAAIAGGAVAPNTGMFGGVPGIAGGIPGIGGAVPGIAGGVPGIPGGVGGIPGSAASAAGLAATPATASAGGIVQIPGFPPILGIPGAAAGGVAMDGEGAAPGVLGGGQIRLLQGAELIGSLTRLQHGDLSGLAAALPHFDAAALASSTHNVARELKASGLGNNIDQTDSMTIDIVAMLFDQIFGDKRVPNALKALIGRLQIPVVKVAVLDKKFFSKKSHPARRMLDTLGEFALGLDETFDQASPLYKKLEAILQRLIEEFDDNLDVFESVQTDLLAVIGEENKRAEEAAKEAARKIAYMERLEVGKAMAQMEIKLRAKSKRMPHLVQRFLTEQWVKLLLLSHARHGKDSPVWKAGLETMDLLIWSATAKQAVDERRKLAQTLPGLLKRLDAGLRAVGTDAKVRDYFFARLMRLHTKVITGTLAVTPAVAAVRAVAAPAPVAAAASVPPPTLTESVTGAAATPVSPIAIAKRTIEQAAQTTAIPNAAPARNDAPDLAAPPLPVFEFDLDAQDKPGPATPDSASAAAQPEAPAQPAAAPVSEPTAQPAAEAVAEVDEDAAPAAEPPEFANITIKNPFGEGEIEVEEISLSDLPGLTRATPAASGAAAGDQYSQSVTNLRAGTWVEFRDDDDRRVQAKLSYVSPLKGTYLFVNRNGSKFGEYSLYELARELRTGNAIVLESMPLIDRAMSSLVGALKKNAKA